jgi:hypothetical protein
MVRQNGLNQRQRTGGSQVQGRHLPLASGWSSFAALIETAKNRNSAPVGSERRPAAVVVTIRQLRKAEAEAAPASRPLKMDRTCARTLSETPGHRR